MSYLDLTNEVFAPLADDVWEEMRRAELLLLRGESGNNLPVRELESRMAGLTGHEAALFLPSTTVATRLYITSLARRGQRAIAERRSHLIWMQHQVLARAGGMHVAPIDGGVRGIIDAESVAAAHEERVLGTQIPTGLVSIENTHNVCGGTFMTPTETARIAETARSVGAECFLDGARVFDAAVAQGVGIADLVAPADAAVIALTKSLGAPYGAIITGSTHRINDIRSIAMSEGTLQVHRRGPFAAAALTLLDRVGERVAHAHANARSFAELLSGAEHLVVRTPETNIVRVDLPAGASAAKLSAELEAEGVGSRVVEASSLRFIPHAGLTAEEVAQAAERVAASALNHLTGECRADERNADETNTETRDEHS